MAKELPTPRSTGHSVVVLGGGLAGMAAACRLLDAGSQVTLVEKRPYLGGRAFSFTDPATGQEVDNGQHIFLGCCVYYIDFLKRLGAFEQARLQPKMRAPVLSPSRGAGLLSAAPLPKPLHLLPSFLSYRLLGFKDKALALYALVKIALTDRTRPALAQESFGGWLRRHRQTRRSIDNFWNLIVKPCVNDDVDDVTAAMAIMVFQEGLLRTRGGSRIGYARVGLSKLMGDAAQEYIEARQGRILGGRTAVSLQSDGRRISGALLSDGSAVRGDAYVSALPWNELASILGPELEGQPFFQPMKGLKAAPIVNVHLWYDRQVMDEEFIALVDSPLQWVFNKTAILGRDDSGEQWVTISLSAAFEYVDKPKKALEDSFVAAMAEAFPRARDAKVKRVLVVKQNRATFRCVAGSERLRPTAKTPVENLFLAGDWTDTGWPSTMEGAVRSGDAAAEAVAGSFPP